MRTNWARKSHSGKSGEEKKFIETRKINTLKSPQDNSHKRRRRESFFSSVDDWQWQHTKRKKASEKTLESLSKRLISRVFMLLLFLMWETTCWKVDTMNGKYFQLFYEQSTWNRRRAFLDSANIFHIFTLLLPQREFLSSPTLNFFFSFFVRSW